jgi:hypothetical protein
VDDKFPLFSLEVFQNLFPAVLQPKDILQLHNLVLTKPYRLR